METPILVLQDSDLTLRTAARADRARLLKYLEDSGSVTLDLSRTDSMSAAYADELFGVLTHYLGMKWILDRVAIVGAHDAVVRAIAEAIDQRSKLGAARNPRRRMHRGPAVPIQH